MTTSTSLDAPAGSPSPQAPPSAPQPPPAAAAPSGPPPAITASRGRLDNRFPSLAFNIRTQGHPYFEVLLATDRSLFDPAAASRRTPSNFYAGRQDGGLLHATAGETAYIVPAAVLKRFADAKPRAGEIFYTVAVYDMPDGPPLLAQPPAMLATMAPSVLLGADYQAKTMAAVLSIPAEKLQPMNAAPGGTYVPEPRAFGDTEVDDDGMPAGQAASWSSDEEEQHATEQAAAALEADPVSMWLADGDPDEPADAGLEEPPAQSYEAGTYAYRDEPDDEPPAYSAGAYAEPYSADDEYDESMAGGTYDDEPEAMSYDAEPEADTEAYEDGYDDEPAAQGYGEAEAEGYAEPYSADDEYDESYGDSEAYEDVDEDYDGAQAYGGDEESPDTGEVAGAAAYDDGYDEELGGEQSAWADSAEASFPPGAVEPAQLADVDDERVDQEIAAESYAYGNGNGHHGNGNGATMLAAAPPRPLDIPARIALLTKVGRSVITPDGYGAIDPDMRFARKKVPWRDGLRFGFLLFSQDSGLLGQLLLMMRQRNPSKFRDGFGADSDKLVTITTKPGPTGRDRPDGRSVRCDPVGGVDLWDTAGHWVGRFTWAGAQKEFQAAQNQLASREYLEPLLGFAKALDLTTERGLALLACRAIGSTGLWTRVGDPAGLARSRVIAAVGPIRGEERTKTALSAIGLRNLSEFQHMNGIKATGSMTAMTHAKLMGALRRLGSASPIPIPTRDQVMDAIVETGSTSQAMLQTIRSGKQFGDAPLAYGTPPVPTPTDM